MDRWLGRQRDGQVLQIGRQMIGRNIHTYIPAYTYTHRTDVEKEKPVKSQYMKGRELEREGMKNFLKVGC